MQWGFQEKKGKKEVTFPLFNFTIHFTSRSSRCLFSGFPVAGIITLPALLMYEALLREVSCIPKTAFQGGEKNSVITHPLEDSVQATFLPATPEKTTQRKRETEEYKLLMGTLMDTQ